MIILVFVLAILLLPTPGQAACTGASPTWTCDSPSDAVTQYGSASTLAGDTINIAAGTFTQTGTCWAFTTTSKHIKLRGAGTPTTSCSNITGSCGAATSGGTTIAVSTTDCAFGFTEATTGHHEISNFTFTHAAASTTTSYGDIFTNPRTVGGKGIIIHHNTWEYSTPNGRAIMLGSSRGVVYRNKASDVRADKQTVASDNYFIEAGYPSNDPTTALAAWQVAATYGTGDTDGLTNLYIETNQIDSMLSATDWNNSLKVVFRYNDLTDSQMKSHGYDSGYGPRHFEMYNNTFRCNTDSSSASKVRNLAHYFHQRGATGVITDNTFEAISTTGCGSVGGVNSAVVRATIYKLTDHFSSGCWPVRRISALTRVDASTAQLVALAAHGLTNGQTINVYAAAESAYNVNAAAVTVVNDGCGTGTNSCTFRYALGSDPGGDATWSGVGLHGGITYNAQSFAVYPGSYPVTRQIGWGYSSGGTTTAEGTASAWTQDLEPTYFWNNTNSAGGAFNASNAPPDTCGNSLVVSDFFQSGREYYADGTAKPSYTKYAYPHQLATETGVSDSGISGSLAPRGRPRWHGPHAKPDRMETP